MDPRIVRTLFNGVAAAGILVGVGACTGSYGLYSLFRRKNTQTDKPLAQTEPLAFSKEEIAKAINVDPNKIRKIETGHDRSYMEIVFKPSFDAHGQMSSISDELKRNDVENLYLKDYSPSGGSVLKIYIDGKNDFNNFVKSKNNVNENLTNLRT